MKFFNSEGRCIRDTTDTEFGFNLSAPDLSDSEDETLPFDVSIRKKYAVAEGKDKISVYDPKIPVYGAKSAVESIVDETPNKTTKIVSGIISKETLADLIEGDSLEAKTLLSVIYPQKASREQDITSRVKVSYDPRNASQVKSTSDLNDRQSIDLQYQDSSKNTLSLMAELTLAEENMKHLMFAQSMEQDSGVDCGDGFLMQNDELRETVTACDYQMLRFQQEVQDLRRKYKIELERTEDLIKETVNLEKDLRETLFLDKLLGLLEGNTDKVTFSNWPFRILSSSSSSNLIV